MTKEGQFAKDGDMFIVRAWPDDDFLIAKRNLGDYIEVEVPDDKERWCDMVVTEIECPNCETTNKYGNVFPNSTFLDHDTGGFTCKNCKSSYQIYVSFSDVS